MNSLANQKRSIRGILFDKDGTLIDFNTFWIPLAFELTDRMSVEYDFSPEYQILLLRELGILPDGKLLPGSIYASGTVQEIIEVLYRHLSSDCVISKTLPEFSAVTQTIIHSYVGQQKGRIKAIGNVGKVLYTLREQGFILGISTSDNEENTRLCLEETGLAPYFDYIGCPDDSKRPKPAGDILKEFTTLFHVLPEEVAIIGDTPTDISFARENRAGLAIGVLSGAGTADSLSGADVLLRDVNELVRFLCS